MLVRAQTTFSEAAKKDGMTKALEDLNDQLPEPVPPTVGRFLQTLKLCSSWSSEQLTLDKKAMDEPVAQNLQPWLSTFVKVKGLDLETLQRDLPEKHELAMAFAKDYEKAINLFASNVKDDLQTSNTAL